MTLGSGQWLAPLGASAAVLAVYVVPGVLTARDTADRVVVPSGPVTERTSSHGAENQVTVRAVDVTGYLAQGRSLRVFYTVNRSTDCSLRIAKPAVEETADAVVIRLDRKPSLAPAEVCPSLLLASSVDISLSRPMAGRVLLDGSRGDSLVPVEPPSRSKLATPSPPGTR